MITKLKVKSGIGGNSKAEAFKISLCPEKIERIWLGK